MWPDVAADGVAAGVAGFAGATAFAAGGAGVAGLGAGAGVWAWAAPNMASAQASATRLKVETVILGVPFREAPAGQAARR